MQSCQDLNSVAILQIFVKYSKKLCFFLRGESIYMYKK